LTAEDENIERNLVVRLWYTEIYVLEIFLQGLESFAITATVVDPKIKGFVLIRIYNNGLDASSI
jgi:hypothetical protein